MANTYKNIVITPNTASSGDPVITFSGANTTANTDVYLRVYPDSTGTLSFEGSAGQLFSITNDLTGSIFTVADVSGIPLADINVTSQQITLGQYYGNVGIGTANATSKLSIVGNTSNLVNVGGNVTAQYYYGNGAFLSGLVIPPGTVNVSTTGPTNNTSGTLWWNSNTGKLLIYYTGGSGSQWVDASPTVSPIVNTTQKLVVANNIQLNAFIENAINITASYTISTGYNAMSAGPITIANGVTITVPVGSTWTIV